ncbi:MAG: hypothetical protein QXV82_09295 [Ignisphaera sp.]
MNTGIKPLKDMEELSRKVPVVMARSYETYVLLYELLECYNKAKEKYGTTIVEELLAISFLTGHVLARGVEKREDKNEV